MQLKLAHGPSILDISIVTLDFLKLDGKFGVVVKLHSQ